MRSLTCLPESRAYGPAKFSSPVQKDFCNTIGQKETSCQVWLKHHAVLLPTAQLTSYCAKDGHRIGQRADDGTCRTPVLAATPTPSPGKCNKHLDLREDPHG